MIASSDGAAYHGGMPARVHALDVIAQMNMDLLKAQLKDRGDSRGADEGE